MEDRSTGFGWIYGLVSIFGLGVLYVVFSQVFNAHLVPIIVDNINGSAIIDAATKLQTIAGIEKYMAYFNIMPFVLIVVIIIWMFVLAIRKERVDV